MVTLTIDGRKVQAEEGTTILEVARENNIYIPTLCHHEEVAPYGACRLCLVEVTRNGRERLVTSCLYEVAEGLKVKTNSERIASNRKTLMELLLARCPNNKAIQDLARQLGVEKTSFKRTTTSVCSAPYASEYVRRLLVSPPSAWLIGALIERWLPPITSHQTFALAVAPALMFVR